MIESEEPPTSATAGVKTNENNNDAHPPVATTIGHPHHVDNNGPQSTAAAAAAAANEPPKLPPKPIREYARVLYAYTGDQADELELKEGDIITILSKDCEDKGWWKGELNNKVIFTYFIFIFFPVSHFFLQLFQFCKIYFPPYPCPCPCQSDWGISRQLCRAPASNGQQHGYNET